MGAIHYNLIEFVLVKYVDDGESINELRILRSRTPKVIGERPADVSVKDWIHENEELATRVVFQDGIWNVLAWESSLYISEIAEYDIDMTNVMKIMRVTAYELK